ncbi:TldD/PmbA family protein [soil metagenome]
MDADLEGLTGALIDAARRAGAEAADAVALAGESLSVEVRGGALEAAERAESIDIGLRVLIGKRQACAAASDIKPATIAAMSERAFAVAREAPEDPWCGLAAPGELARDWDAAVLQIEDPRPAPDPAGLERMAREAEAAALGIAGVSMMDVAGAGWQQSRQHLAATNGFSSGFGRTSSGVHAVAITGEGTAMERDWAFESRVFAADLPEPADIGRLAGERAVMRAGAGKPPTGAWPVLFDERVAGSLIGHLTQAANGASIARGSSWLKDALGAPVLPAGIDLIEDPRRVRIPGSRPVDAEGLATARRSIVAKGVLTGWTLDLATARQLGMRSTGSAGRGVSSPPSPSTGNLWLTHGPESLQDLMAAMGEGLYVTALIGASINPTTGDYSRGAAGFWIRGGEIVRPVNECTIAGSLPAMLRTIRPADDGRRTLSRVVPSLLVEGLTIAGE